MASIDASAKTRGYAGRTSSEEWGREWEERQSGFPQVYVFVSDPRERESAKAVVLLSVFGWSEQFMAPSEKTFNKVLKERLPHQHFRPDHHQSARRRFEPSFTTRTALTMDILKHASSFLSLRSNNEKPQRSVHRKASILTALDSQASLSPTSSSTSASNPASSFSSATSILPTDDEACYPRAQPLVCPPASVSEFRWNYLDTGSRRVWWRTVDSMANFILHWQTRFHQHGDMFGSCTLSLSTPSSSSASAPCHLSIVQLREAVRRLRFNHPTVALRLAKRQEFAIERLVGIPESLEGKVDLQVALVYEAVESDREVDEWLDEVLIVHTEERQTEDTEFDSFIASATADGVAGRDRLRIHYWPHSPVNDARVLVEQCHSVSEGIGTLLVFNLLLESIASVLSDPTPNPLPWGAEVARLEPALQDAIANPPESWHISKEEVKQLQKVNASQLSKTTPPTLLDKLGVKVLGLTLDNHSSKSAARAKVLNKPLVSMCRAVTEKGAMFPLGLLPQPGLAFTGTPTHTSSIATTLSPTQTRLLLTVLKQRGVSLAPFLEACSHMATTWTRKYRGLVPNPKKRYRGFDDPSSVLGSFSNAVSKRDTLRPEHSKYLGLCLSGFPTKVSAGAAVWSLSSETHSIRSPTDSGDKLPQVCTEDVATLFKMTSELVAQYNAGRDNANWLRYDKALMFSTMQTEYLLLRRAEHYPSMPWLSSIGRLENVFAGTYPIDAHPSRDEGEPTSLEAHNMRLLGRVGIRQPILHVYSFRKQMTIQFSFADWLYTDPKGEARKVHGPNSNGNDEKEGQQEKQNILEYWLQVYKQILEAVLVKDASSPTPTPTVQST